MTLVKQKIQNLEIKLQIARSGRSQTPKLEIAGRNKRSEQALNLKSC
jgi:hypothetical protein